MIGSIIADIAIIAILIISIFQAYKRGLTMLVFHLACLVITLIVVFILCKPITDVIFYNTGFGHFISTHIEDSIGNFIEENIKDDKLIDSKNTNLPESIVNKINDYVIEARESSSDNISKFVSDKLSYIAVSAIVVILLFIIVRIATLFLKGVLYFLSHLPLIRSFDKLGGAVYGIIRGYIIIYGILAIISLLSPLFADSGLIACIKHSNICSIFYNNNILFKIFG